MKNATYTVSQEGLLTLTHLDCGRTQKVEPITAFPDGRFGFGSDADFCLACENEDRPAGLRY